MEYPLNHTASLILQPDEEETINEYISDFIESRETRFDSMTDTLVDPNENWQNFSLQPPQALHHRVQPATSIPGALQSDSYHSQNARPGQDRNEILQHMNSYVFPPTSTTSQARHHDPQNQQRRRNVNFSLDSNNSHDYTSAAADPYEKSPLISPRRNSKPDLSTGIPLTTITSTAKNQYQPDYIVPTDPSIPISTTDARKGSIYKPVHHKPLTHINTSIFHIFRFATTTDYLLIMFATFFSISNGLTIPLMSQLLGNLFDVFTQQESGVIGKTEFQRRINELVLDFMALGVCTFILSTLMAFTWMWTAERQAREMRKTYFKSLLRMNMGWFERDEITSGGLLTSLNKDADDIQNAIGENLGATIQYTASAIGCIILAFYKNIILTLVIMAILPAICAVLIYTSRAATPLIRKERSIFLQAGNILEYTLSEIKTVRSFNGETIEEQRHQNLLQEVNTYSSRLAFVYGLRTGLMQFLMLSLFVQGFWFGATLVANKKLSPGGVLFVFYACLLGAAMVKAILPLLGHFARAKNAVRAINELLEKVALLDLEALRGFKLSKCEGNIELQQVNFAYPSRPDTLVLRNVDLVIPAGKTTVLVGTSGSGKSTVAQLIQRLYDTKEGLVLLDGREVGILNTQWLREQIGIVSQEPVLFDDTIFQNVAYGKADYWNVTRDEVVAACRIACIHEFIKNLPEGYETQLGDKGHQLSGGQRQRLAIARAIIKDPPILILDEASSALDATSDNKVQKALENSRQGRTTLVITHHLSNIKDSDLVYVLEKGDVVEHGLKQDLMANRQGHLYKLATQNDISRVKRRTKQLQFVDLRLKRTSSLLTKRLKNEQDYDLSTSAGLLKRSLSMATRLGWRQSIYEDYFDTNAMEVLNQSATASITKRNDNRASYFGVLSYYDEIGEDNNIIDILVASEQSSLDPKKNRLSFLHLLKTTMDNKFIYAMGLLAAVANGFVMPAFSYVLSELLTTYALPDKSQLQSEARYWAIVVLGIAIVNGLTAHFKYFLLERASEQWGVRLRHLGFGRILKQPQPYFDKPENAPGKLATILINDTDHAKHLVGHFAGSIVNVAFTLLVGIIWAFVDGWQLALVGFGLVPIVVFATKGSGFLLQKYERQRKASSEDAANAFYQTMSSVRTVFSLSIEGAMQRKFNTALKKPYEIGLRKAIVAGLCMGAMEALQYFARAITFYYGAHLVSTGVYDLKTMLTIWTLIIFCTTTASNVLVTLPYYAKSKQAAKTFCTIMALPEPPLNGARLDRVSGNVTFKNISFAYPERPDQIVLKGLNLNVMYGKTVALVGKSGNGKSTVAALLQRFYEPASGSIQLDYNPISTLNLQFLRSQIGVVSQQPVLFDTTIRENIAYGNSNITQQEIEHAAKQVNVHDFIMSLPNGYDTKIGAGGSQLSGGQKQRIAIARVLVRRPKILILDEATSALDTENERVVNEALMWGREDRATLIITHRLEAVRNADRIAVLERGSIEELGTHQELMDLGGIYWRLCNGVESSKPEKKLRWKDEVEDEESGDSEGAGDLY